MHKETRLHIVWWWKKTSGQGRVILKRENCYILKIIVEAFLFKPNKACNTILTGLMSLWNKSARDYVCQSEEAAQ